ncbi:hypothetical protein EVAR_91566_1 [Eumeta japonica]|uniref:Uncharacterized protein n=1 Tax=Eumeta variegata TaxID=151549 RepID=A0A4C1XCV8_EUMVA|nr:hypothetical protein EVAR_91566_1 [Eumeta japonica]
MAIYKKLLNIIGAVAAIVTAYNLQKPNQNIDIVLSWKKLLKNNPRMNIHITLHGCRGRKRMKAAEQINDGASTSAAGVSEAIRADDVITSISTLDSTDINCGRTPIIKDTFSSS